MLPAMDPQRTAEFVDGVWGDAIVPSLIDYIRIPNVSPLFDPDWEAHGHMEQAVRCVADWCRAHAPEQMEVEVVRLPGRTPVILMELPGDSDHTVLLYGHLDKQPPMDGWHDGLGPWEPVLRDGKLYGRGGADDGYAAYASLTAINALREQGVPHGRCVVLIEACEESGSYDLPYYLEVLAERIGRPELVVCLDSGCGNYEQLWCTTSLRGLVLGTLRVDVLTEGIHSGDGGGIVPGTFRIVRELLGRLEDGVSGAVILPELVVDIPAARREQARRAAETLGDSVGGKYPLLPGVVPTHADPVELVLNRTWRASLAVTGQDGLMPLATAGNVLRPHTALKLSLRLPPTCDGEQAAAQVKRVLEADPPYGARVSFEVSDPCSGWNAPPVAGWLEAALDEASRTYFGPPACSMGEGGTIPFMAMLGERFPEAQYMITGVLGPASNAHGPNEFLHLDTGRRLTSCVAHVLAEHQRNVGA